MAKRLNTLVLAAEATVPATHAALPDAVQASIEQRCMNPVCTKLCNWPRTGRPRLFCCRECRQAYDYERAELLADTRTIAEALDRPGGTYKQRRALQTELARRRWCLIRYGDPAASSGIQRCRNRAGDWGPCRWWCQAHPRGLPAAPPTSQPMYRRGSFL